MEKTKTSFNELDESIQRELMLKQRAVEAINDQQLTQQLFFLLERKNRIKNAFEHIEALQPYSLADIDLNTVDKINRFIAIIDLLSSPHLSDPAPYIAQLKFKQQSILSSSIGGISKAVNIARLVVKRQKKTPLAETPAQLTKQAKTSRNSTGNALVQMIDGQIKTGKTPAIRTDAPDSPTDDIILEGISLDNEEDIHNFSALLKLIESNEDVQLKDFEAFSKPVIVPKSMLKFSELCNKFYDEQSKEWKHQKTHTMNLSCYQTFIDIVGDKFVDELDYPHANLYIDTLRKLPRNRKKSPLFRDKSIEEIIAMESSFEPMPSINVNKNIERLKSVFLWAVQRKYIKINILDKMRVKDKAQKSKTKDLRERFSIDDLSLIFGSDKYTKGKHNRTYEYWVPLLSLYTGARAGELSQLRLNDIYTENGTWLIDFNEEEDKKLKTINCIRKVPVHKTLMRLGFIKYVQQLKNCYEANITHRNLLFPDIVKGRDGYGDNPGKFFIRYLIALKIKSEGKSFHSFRHTFADERKQADSNPAMTAELMGHEIDNETLGRYGKDYKITLKKVEIDRYVTLSDEQIKKILPFKLWKEFRITNTMSKQSNALIDMNKSIYSDKHLHNALFKIQSLKVTPPVIVPRKPRKAPQAVS
ncbi:site-specific integrase [Colwellia piezophila]|uniref:site-specific integrase n=1 Tax=Colwellia piezophila TaxID=211668 RepID=UPI000365A863|nr:site-specific integrase [Colwellia piezophila]